MFSFVANSCIIQQWLHIFSPTNIHQNNVNEDAARRCCFVPKPELWETWCIVGALFAIIRMHCGSIERWLQGIERAYEF